jgi:hypothetical protein
VCSHCEKEIVRIGLLKKGSQGCLMMRMSYGQSPL